MRTLRKLGILFVLLVGLAAGPTLGYWLQYGPTPPTPVSSVPITFDRQFYNDWQALRNARGPDRAAPEPAVER